MATGSRKFQAPKGTRDFYPQDMAVRRYIEGVWRQTSIKHGFDEVEGPMFEDLELYMHKSGPGIVSELFQVYSGKDKAEIEQIQKTGQAPFALRPEFTPTLARMVAAKAAELPRPIKWFAIPQHFRAERPQRGRLREFLQWNVDFIGGEDPMDSICEVVATSISAFQTFGLSPEDLQIKLNHRGAIRDMLRPQGIDEEHLETALEILDALGRTPRASIVQGLTKCGATNPEFLVNLFDEKVGAFKAPFHDVEGFISLTYTTDQLKAAYREALQSISHFYEALKQPLAQCGMAEWCWFNTSVVRGLAYYTGVVFEVHEVSGAERAIAGGGRYDNLIESFGGPKLPACGFGMGDVVLGNLLHDKGLLPEEVYMKSLRPHAFAIAANDEAEPKMRQTVAALRREGFHVRHSYKTTRNVGKLLGDASKSRAMTAIIFGKDVAADRIDLKDLDGETQETIAISEIAAKLKDVIRRNDEK